MPNDSLNTPAWQHFIKDIPLTEVQAGQFQRYMHELVVWNEKFNLTAITETSSIIQDHFQDSLALTDFITLSSQDYLADVGTGAGFPGIPLKIMFPHIPVLLVEVNQKKIGFLRHIINELKLSSIEICDMDWRSFIHHAPYPITLFLARASLRPPELVKIFNPTCAYKNARVVYWASYAFELGQTEKPFLQQEYSYTVGDKKRRLLLFSKHIS